MTKVYVVIRNSNIFPASCVGVYSTRELAEENCLDGDYSIWEEVIDDGVM